VAFVGLSAGIDANDAYEAVSSCASLRRASWMSIACACTHLRG
jgi:hypothetical protein